MLEKKVASSAVAELPPPSPELVILAALVESFLETLPKKERARFLQRVTTTLARYEAWAGVANIRPESQEAVAVKARADAAAWWRLLRVVFDATER